MLDAGIPGRVGMSRLDVMAEESPEFATSLQSRLAAGAVFPDWTAEDLEGVVPEPRTLVADLRPRTLDYFVEPVGVPDYWPAAPVAYLHLSAAYDTAARAAASSGWPVERLDRADHFHMLVDPVAVAVSLDRLIARMISR